MKSNRRHHGKSRPGSTSGQGRAADGPARPERYSVETERGPELRPELVDEEARIEARCCRRVTDTQMRRFYGAAKSEQMTMETDNQARVAMALLKAKAHYAAARDEKNKELADLFRHHARLIRTAEDFGHFMQHFEAVIAYHKFDQKERR